MSINRICPFAALLIAMFEVSGCEVLTPSAASEATWQVIEPNSTVVLGDSSHSRITQLCMDDGFRTEARVMADRSRPYALVSGNCIDVEASVLEVSVPCAKDCTVRPLASGTVTSINHILPSRGTWILGDGDTREVVHLVDPRFYEFCNFGQQPVRLFSDYRITDRDIRPGACGAVRGREIGVRSDAMATGSSGAYRYVE